MRLGTGFLMKGCGALSHGRLCARPLPVPFLIHRWFTSRRQCLLTNTRLGRLLPPPPNPCGRKQIWS